MADFLPTASLDVLRLRAELLARVRKFFTDRGFLEVETPILSADVTVDRHLDPMSTVLANDSRQPQVGRTLWLQTSPEFGMKRLLAAGATAIYQITRAFRNAEIGPLHNPEFTIVEWYRVGDNMQAGMSLLADFCQALLGTPPAERLSYADAIERHVHVNPHIATVSELAAVAKRLGINAPLQLSDSRDDWLNLLLAERVEPNLGKTTPTILYDYPASQAALAKTRQEKFSSTTHQTESVTYSVAERFELYFHGLELANGYHELLDAGELSRRNALANVARQKDSKPALPEQSRLLAAMQAGLPACTGVALGFDRLVMLASGAKKLSEVVAFPIDRA
jgi:elongation factor P--(R)-beta-lysine ligase